MDYDYLLQQYRSIWNHRMLPSKQNSEVVLEEAVLRELLDENSHPRTRRSRYDKFYLAVSRIIDSELPDQDKLALISLHKKNMETIKARESN
ncbi:hypothetical protein CVD25_06910 [Bacillus canaveralius]|uniref:Uncharacterized protein n=1 Tax=Bacillus canaveralius TaxID=1403243 RepID=A0A2N5GIZ5_9BACI|nr:hypothetical protein [Bacillus canaveralius]PLR81023.1 hypothetical protein CU635_16040 [Bacillus canaveralius]PLR99001.1 hypothetical protein CVD25_06910 [Bacillus canaveralius]